MASKKRRFSGMSDNPQHKSLPGSPSTLESGSKKPKYTSEFTETMVKKNPILLQNDGRPPNTYQLVLYGHARMTEWLLEHCRKAKEKVWIAHDRDARFKSNTVGYNVSRHGYYFPKALVRKASDWFKVTVRNGKVSDSSGSKTNLSRDSAREHLNELYPRIADLDRERVLDRLNPRTGSKIGKSSDHSPHQKIELAVISHVRHRYTDYDKLLKQGYAKFEARKLVGTDIQDVLNKWKGEGKTEDEWEVEFKEVITLNDDEDEEDHETSQDEYTPTLGKLAQSQTAWQVVDEEEYKPWQEFAWPRKETDEEEYEPPPAQARPPGRDTRELQQDSRQPPSGYHIALRPVAPIRSEYVDLTESPPTCAPGTRIQGDQVARPLLPPPPPPLGHAHTELHQPSRITWRKLSDSDLHKGQPPGLQTPRLRWVPVPPNSQDILPTIEHSSPQPHHTEHMSVPISRYSRPAGQKSPTHQQPSQPSVPTHSRFEQHERYDRPIDHYPSYSDGRYRLHPPPPAPPGWYPRGHV